jgi:hypothetical protein
LKLFAGGISTVLLIGVVLVALSGLNTKPSEVLAAPPSEATASGKKVITNLSATLSKEESSISLPPTGVLQGIKPASTSVTADDVKKTFKGSNVKDMMNATLARVNAEPEVNIGDEFTDEELKEYKTVVSEYSDRIYKAGTETLNESDIKNYLSEFQAWCSKFKRTKAVGVVLLDNPVTMQPPRLKEQYLTYEPYTAITSEGTPHYKLRNLATSTEEGYRVYNGFVLVALASYYGTDIGTTYNIYFDDGKVMKAILGDNKSDLHTDTSHKYRDASDKYDGSSGNIVEIIFDTSLYNNSEDKEKINQINKKINSDYPGKVIKIEKTGVAKEFK